MTALAGSALRRRRTRQDGVGLFAGPHHPVVLASQLLDLGIGVQLRDPLAELLVLVVEHVKLMLRAV